MPFIADAIFDLALARLDTESNRLDITTQECANYTEATSTYTKGNKTSLTVGAPADRTPSGRKVTVAAITANAVSGTGTVTHWAITYTTSSRLDSTGALSASKAVVSGDTFDLAAFDIGFADAT